MGFREFPRRIPGHGSTLARLAASPQPEIQPEIKQFPKITHEPPIDKARMERNAHSPGSSETTKPRQKQ